MDDPIVEYSKSDALPKSPEEAKRVKITAARYVLIDGMLYRRGYSKPFLRCLSPSDANYIIREIHEWIVSAHEGARALARNVLL